MPYGTWFCSIKKTDYGVKEMSQIITGWCVMFVAICYVGYLVYMRMNRVAILKKYKPNTPAYDATSKVFGGWKFAIAIIIILLYVLNITRLDYSKAHIDTATVVALSVATIVTIALTAGTLYVIFFPKSKE
jgi:hypothetical protein